MLKHIPLIVSRVQAGLWGLAAGSQSRLVNLLALFLALSAAWCFAMADSAALQWTCLATIFCLPLQIAFPKVGLSLRARGMFVMVVAYSFMWVSAIQTGAIHAAIAGGLVFIPAFAVVLGRKTALTCIGLSLLMIAGLTVLTLFYPTLTGTLLEASQSPVGWSLGLQVSGLIALFFCILLLERLQEERYEQLESQTHQLKQAYSELENAKAYQDNVVASVSHELRTPMNAILGFNELLQTEITHPAAAQISDHISASARQLLRVINGILDYSQLVAGKLRLQREPVSVRKMVEKLEQIFAPLAAEKNLALTVELPGDEDLKIFADGERLPLVLDHLLTNALKFTHHGHVTLRVTTQGSQIRFEVEDTGIGIPEAQQALVFGRFHQGSQEINRRYGGTGLGLAICEQIVQLHEGRMGLTSTEGVGSTFWVEISQFEDACKEAPKASKARASLSVPDPAEMPPPVARWYMRLDDALRSCVRKWHQKSSDEGHEDRIMGFLIFWISTIVFSSVYALPYPGAPTAMLGWTMTPIFTIVLLIFLKGYVSLTFSVNFITIYSAVHLFVMALYTGGIHSATMPWFSLLPLTQIHLINTLAAFVWLGIGLVINVLMAWLTSQGLLPVSPAIPDPSWVWPVINYIHLCFAIPYLPLLYNQLHGKSMRRMGEQNDRLLVAKKALLLEKKRMEEFISSVSHEFRTPMNAIMGFTALLEEHVQGSAAALEMHGHMTQSAKHLLTVIDDILDYSQLKKGQLAIRREAFDLRQVCESAYEMFKSRVQARHTNYRLNMHSQPLWVEGDSHRLMQLLVNLLGNAVKFTDKGLIEFSVVPSQEGVLFEVRDTGIGIAPERVGQLFQHFEQVHALLPGRYEGNGLGLAISKRLVELQGGRISVSSALGVGSVFSMWLPLRSVPAPQPVVCPSLPLAESTQILKVLVVDDHPLNRMLVRKILERNWPQAVLVEAGDGAEAIEKMTEQVFDAVLMDMLMPVMDGIEATQHIRKVMQPPHNQTPILGLTANVNLVDKQRCMDAGMTVVLYKPLNKEVLIHHIEAILGNPERKSLKS